MTRELSLVQWMGGNEKGENRRLSLQISALIRMPYSISNKTIISWYRFHGLASKYGPQIITILTSRLMSSMIVTRQVRLTNVDDGLIIYEQPEPGVSVDVEWRLSEGESGKDLQKSCFNKNPQLIVMVGFTLEEYYVVNGTRFMWLDTKVYGGYQPQTIMFLLHFFENIARGGGGLLQMRTSDYSLSQRNRQRLTHAYYLLLLLDKYSYDASRGLFQAERSSQSQKVEYVSRTSW